MVETRLFVPFANYFMGKDFNDDGSLSQKQFIYLLMIENFDSYNNLAIARTTKTTTIIITKTRTMLAK